MLDEERQALTRFEAAIGHGFADRERLLVAVTHRSYRHESGGEIPDNERLEFLGDAILNLAASLALARRLPHATEGELTRRRAALVSESALAALARELDLGAVLRLGRGEELSGGRDKDSLLADALEAVIAAVEADAGLASALAIAGELLAPRIDEEHEAREDYKSLVQQRVQVGGGEPPRYRVVATDGPDHERRFFVEILVGGACKGRGEGRSKKEAEQNAARAALEDLGDPGGDG